MPANDVVKPVYGRMPLVIDPADSARWLDPATAAAEVAALLRPRTTALLTAVRVGTAVNAVRNDGPACVAPAA